MTLEIVNNIILADAIYNLSGFGFNGYDAETGEAKWDLATNVHAWKVEVRSIC